MIARDRVLAALNFEEADRPPVFASFVPEIEERLRDRFCIDALDLGAALGNDLVKSCAGLEASFYGGPEPEYTDPWGIRWCYAKNAFGSFTEIAEHPLAGDPSRLDSFEIPDPEAGGQYDAFRRMKAAYGKEKFLIGSSQISIFEASWYLRGLDTFLMDLVAEPDYAHALMDKVMQFPLGAARKFVDLGADMVWFGDDVSMQSGMMISREMWRKFLKGRYALLFAACKEAGPRVKIAYHSCGNCETILDDLIEIGLDVLNPIQPTAMDPMKIKKRYGKRLALFGGLCVQHVMPRGNPDEVRKAVLNLKAGCGKGGGYILAPAHHIQGDTPIDNITAFYEAALSTKK